MDCNIQDSESTDQIKHGAYSEQGLPTTANTRSGGDFSKHLIGVKPFPSPKSSELFDDLHSEDVQLDDVEICSGTYEDNAGIKLKVELSRYKQEIRDYNNTTKDLEQKYRKINTELNEMQQKHERFVAKRKKGKPHYDRSSDTKFSTSDSEITSDSLDDKSDLSKYQKKKHKWQNQQFPDQGINEYCGEQRIDGKCHCAANDEKTTQGATILSAAEQSELKDIYKALKTMISKRQNKHENSHSSNYKTEKTETISSDEYSEMNHGPSLKSGVGGGAVNMRKLHDVVANLQNEQSKSNALIKQQQKCLHDYHSRCKEAQQKAETQQKQIQHLHSNNSKLEAEFSEGIEQLRIKIDAKLKEVSQLPKMICDEREKNERSSRENKALSERLRVLQQEARVLKANLEELTKRKALVMARLKVATKDLKIFKNHNTALKMEKKKLSDELAKLKEQMAGIQYSNKRIVARQRDGFEKQRRDLQKRIYDLEIKLSRSQKSTSSIIQERDRVIGELQGQLNTLVHNFEMSQTHIRILRRHIHNGSLNSTPSVVNATNFLTNMKKSTATPKRAFS